MKLLLLVLMSTFILTTQTYAQTNATAKEREFFPTCTPSFVSFRTTNQDCGERFVNFVESHGLIMNTDSGDAGTSIFYFSECERIYTVKVDCSTGTTNGISIEENGKKSDKTLAQIQSMVTYYLNIDHGVQPEVNIDKIQYRAVCL
ncbi:hypothetical protein IPF86_01820 [Candidatus Nomurabacteria bacterium]|nr:MAG: hypothetical protein IPF86_01820 [Candidatus Nomurabacteria bacterium]